MRLFRNTIYFVILLLAGFALPQTAWADVSFSRDIAPLVLKRCTGCHGERANLGGYRAHTYQSLMRAGASGKAAIVAGKPEDSIFYQRISAKIEPLRMPKSDDPLSTAQIALVRQWILAGAKFDGSDAALPLKNLLGPRVHPAAPAIYRAAVPVMALTFAPDGKAIYLGGYNEITVWNAETGAMLKRMGHQPQRIQALQFSRDGKTLLVAGGTPGEYGEIALIHPDAGTRQVLDTFGDIALAAVFSPDGKHILAGGADGGVRMYDAASGKRLWESKVHSDWVTGVSMSFDNRFVVSSSKDMTIKVYEAETGTLFTTYNGHNRQIGQYKGAAPVYAVQFAPESDTVYSAGGGKWIQIWNPIQAQAESGDAGDQEERFAKQGSARYIPLGFSHEVYALAVQDGQVFAASADGVLKQFDAKTFQEVRAYTGHTDWIFSLNYHSPTHRIATGGYDGAVRVWDAQTGACIVSFKAMPGVTAASR